jgi:hypothetical protein
MFLGLLPDPNPDPVSQRYGSEDPDPNPYQNVTDPQHCQGLDKGSPTWRRSKIIGEMARCGTVQGLFSTLTGGGTRQELPSSPQRSCPQWLASCNAQ